MAEQISILQEYQPKDWAGLTTANQLGSIFKLEPQKATKLVTILHNANRGMSFGRHLDMHHSITLDSDDDFRWELVGDSKKNIPLTECKVNNAAITAASQVGKAGARFTLIFPEQYFSDVMIIVGEKNSTYPIRICNIPEPNGSFWDYECELLTGDQDLFIPYDELTAGKRYSKEWGLVEKTLSKKGAGVTYTSPFSMINTFSMIRIQDTRPGNMIKRKISAFAWPVVDLETGKTKIVKTWLDYADWVLENEFQDHKDKLLNFATTNKADDGTYKQTGYSGFKIEQGAGLEQQMESGHISWYNDFDLDIKWLTEHIMDLTDNSTGYGDRRDVVLRTGKWGAYNFSEAIQSYTQLYTPLTNTEMLAREGDGWVYTENFKGYRGPDGTKVSVLVDPLYDDKERNKILHPSGKGVAQSYVYDILNVGRVGGEDNIQIVYQKGSEDIMGFVPGLRDPYQPTDNNRHIMASGVDGYTVHRAFIGGVMIKDPTRCARIKPNILA